MKLIDKDAVVAEINRYLEYANNGILYAQSGIEKGLKEYESDLNAWQHCQSMCKNILSFLDNLEEKEVDLENSMVCKVDWYDGFLLDYTQEQQDELLEKIGANVGDKIRVILIKE